MLKSVLISNAQRTRKKRQSELMSFSYPKNSNMTSSSRVTRTTQNLVLICEVDLSDEELGFNRGTVFEVQERLERICNSLRLSSRMSQIQAFIQARLCTKIYTGFKHPEWVQLARYDTNPTRSIPTQFEEQAIVAFNRKFFC